MLLNGSPLNSVPLNGGADDAVPPAGPVYVVRGQSYLWRLRLVVGGVDMTAQWVGEAEDDREEGAAGVASFALYLPPSASPVAPDEWVERTFALTYISMAAGVTVEERRFTGRIANPVWDPRTRLMSCECSDRMQMRVEAMPIAAIDTLVGGHWSADVFEAVEGRSHWDYAMERMGTRTASLDCSPQGELRVTSWYAGAPDFVFGPGTALDNTVVLDLAPGSKVTNRAELDVVYRYVRLWQRNQAYSWQHPGTEGMGGIGGFCEYRSFASELPNKDMVEEAAAANGQTVLDAAYYELPPTMADPCGDGSPWINREEGLLLGAVWNGARRWAQTITESYPVVLATAAGVDEATRIVERSSYGLEVDAADQVAAWESDPITGGTTGFVDVPDEGRRQLLFVVALLEWFVKIVQAHRAKSVSWSVHTSMALGIDLTHTLEINDQGIRARGKCRRIVDSFDPNTGEPITTFTIALMRGGGVSDPMVAPPALGAGSGDDGADSGAGLSLPTQISYWGGPDYDETLNGFSGNSDAGGGPSSFPRELVVPVDEILETDRDERVLTGAALYRVGIPNDLLEM